MTPRSLFIIIIKIIGLYFLIDIIRVVPQFLSTITYLFRGDVTSGLIGIVCCILLIAIYLFLVKYILFKADKIVEKLGLDKNFDEEKFEFNIHRSSVIKISVMLIGGMLLVDYTVPFILNLYSYIQEKNQSNINSMLDAFAGGARVSQANLVHGFVMILIGYFLVTNSRMITNWIEKKRKDKTDPQA